jgi:hypothetical protein
MSNPEIRVTVKESQIFDALPKSHFTLERFISSKNLTNYDMERILEYLVNELNSRYSKEFEKWEKREFEHTFMSDRDEAWTKGCTTRKNNFKRKSESIKEIKKLLNKL